MVTTISRWNQGNDSPIVIRKFEDGVVVIPSFVILIKKHIVP